MNLLNHFISDSKNMFAVSMATASYGEDPLWFSLGLPVGVMHLSQDHPCFIMPSVLQKVHGQISAKQQHDHMIRCVIALGGEV